MASPFFFDDDGYYWTLKITTASDNEVQEQEQEVLFNRLGNARTKEIMRLAVEKNKRYQETGEVPADDATSDEALAAEILGGWRTMKNRAGDQIPYTPESRTKFLNREGVAAAIVMGWFESKQARKEGNSEAPPASSGS
jgi:hypothetical protein